MLELILRNHSIHVITFMTLPHFICKCSFIEKCWKQCTTF